MSLMSQVYGIDTSVFVRLLTGHPRKDFEANVQGIQRLLALESSAEIVVSNQVIGEAYIALQHHYGISKMDARAAMLLVFKAGSVSPLNGSVVIEILNEKKGSGIVLAN